MQPLRVAGEPARKGRSWEACPTKLPPPPPKSPLRAPQPPPPSKTEQPDLKKRREPKGKEVMEIGRPHPSIEEEAHRPTNQQRVSHAPSRGPEMGEAQLPEPQAWLLAPMLDGEPLIDNVSIRDYNGGISCHVAPVLEETHLLSKDMVELRGLRRNEVFLQAKRFLGMVCIFPPSVSFFSFYLV